MSHDPEAGPESGPESTPESTPELDGGIPDEVLPDDVRPDDDNPLAKGPTDEDEDPDAGFSPDAPDVAPGG